MGEHTSPLQAINQKELDVRHRLEEVQRQAEARRQAARKEAEQLIAQADRAGRAEAEALYRQGIEQARREAEVLVTGAQEQAAALRRRAMARLDQAARQIIDLVLPANVRATEETQTEIANKSEQVRSH